MRLKVSDWETIDNELKKETDWKFGVLRDHIKERTAGKRSDAIIAIGIPTPLLRTVLQTIARFDMSQYRVEKDGEAFRYVPFKIDIPLEE